MALVIAVLILGVVPGLSTTSLLDAAKPTLSSHTVASGLTEVPSVLKTFRKEERNVILFSNV